MHRTGQQPGGYPAWPCLPGGRQAFLRGFRGTASVDALCHFHKLYLGTDICGPIHVDETMQPEPADRCLGKGLSFQFQTTHTCTVNKCSRGYWSTAFMWGPKALLSSALPSPAPPPDFPRTFRPRGNLREKLGAVFLERLHSPTRRGTWKYFNLKELRWWGGSL